MPRQKRAEDVLGDLAGVVAQELELAERRRRIVLRARRAGHSWTEIGYHLGTSAQAAQQRYGGQSSTSSGTGS